MSDLTHRIGLISAAIIVTAAGFGALPAYGVNLGDIPANRAALSPTCTKIAFMGPMITAWCWDKSDLVFKSEVDVRSCVGYGVVVDSTAHIRCRARLKRP
jgi:hypothetical protein